MGTFDESILTETKHALGIDEEVSVFDQEIRMHINSALGTLNQLGLGPEGGFEVNDVTEKWVDFLATDLNFSPVKTYVHLRVKLLFDPPANSWTITSMKDQIEQLEWRLNIVREDTIPFDPSPIPEEDEGFLLDGGTI